ncbi:MAG: sulfite exporter TauE/SafE family protein [Pseudomonadota bacterium]
MISFLAAVIHGVVGFGFNFLCAPLLLLVYPKLVPAPLIIMGTAMVCLVAWTNRKDVAFDALGWLVGACALGSLAAGVALSMIKESAYSALFGSLLLLAVVLSLLGWRPKVTAMSASIAGGISGFMGTITAVGGPPAALLLHGLSAQQLRGTMSAYFLMSAPFIFLALYGAGRLGWQEVKLAPVLLPGMLLGFACSKYLTKYLSTLIVRRLVLSICAGSGVVLLVRSW